MDNVREIPQSTECEAAVLGACLLSPLDCVPLAQSTLKIGCEAFYDLRHRAIFKIMEELDSQRIQADPTAVIQRLKDQGLLEQVGLSYVATLPEACSSPANIKHYLDVVKQKSVLRQFIELCDGGVSKAYETKGEDAAGLVESLEVELKKLNEQGTAKEFDLKNQLRSLIEQMQHDWQNPGEGIGTGLKDLDRATDLHQPGEVVVIAARPGAGKTAIAINIAYHNIARLKPVGIISLEMSDKQLLRRFLALHSALCSKRIRDGFLSEDEKVKLVEATKWIGKQPLLICDRGGMNIHQIRTQARRWVLDRKIEVLIIDYLQLTDSGKKHGNREEEVAYVSKTIKAMAMELGIPIVALAQLNRASESEGREPRMSDLRNSGAVEQDADKILLMHKKDEETINSVVQVFIAKNRSGEAGSKIDLLFKKPTSRFCLLEKEYG